MPIRTDNITKGLNNNVIKLFNKLWHNNTDILHYDMFDILWIHFDFLIENDQKILHECVLFLYFYIRNNCDEDASYDDVLC